MGFRGITFGEDTEEGQYLAAKRVMDRASATLLMKGLNQSRRLELLSTENCGLKTELGQVRPSRDFRPESGYICK